jgi:proteasome lid subunit RPN8/RPN11
MDNLSVSDKSLKKIFEYLKEYSDKYFNIECCAFVGKNKNKYVAQFVPNRSPHPNVFFCIDPVDFLKFKSENEMVCLFHSHPSSDEKFSEQDINNSEATCLPFLVYSLPANKFSLYEPKVSESDVNTLNKVKGLI